MPTDTDTDTDIAEPTEPTEETPGMLNANTMKALASHPIALVLYVVATIAASGGAGYMGGGMEEDLDDHVHEEGVTLEARRHWTPDERRASERRIAELEEDLAELEEKLENPPVQVDAATQERLRLLEVEIGAAVRLLELKATRSPPGGASP